VICPLVIFSILTITYFDELFPKLM